MAARCCGRRRGVRISLFLFALGSTTLVATARSADNPKPQKAPRLYEAPTDAQTIGKERCLECHAEKREKLQKIHSECESCHRAGSTHVEKPSRETIAYPNDTACPRIGQPGRLHPGEPRKRWALSGMPDETHAVSENRTVAARGPGLGVSEGHTPLLTTCIKDRQWKAALAATHVLGTDRGHQARSSTRVANAGSPLQADVAKAILLEGQNLASYLLP